MDPIMKPNPMLMVLKNMRQSKHGEGNYMGNLSGTEKVVFSEEEAEEWIENTLQTNEKATLIEITEIRTYSKNEQGTLSSEAADESTLTREEAYSSDTSTS